MQKEIVNYLYLIAGSAILAFGVAAFIIPGGIATGGTPGAAILLHHLTGLPTGMLMTAVNIPLLAAGIKVIGRGFALRTVAAIIISSVFIDILTHFFALPLITESTMLATLYGGITVGAGVGLILKGNASAGGSSIVARLAAAKTELKPGQVIMMIDLVIIISSGFVFNDIEKALWSLINIYVIGKVVDLILTGASTEKVVHITTSKPAELSRLISESININGSILSGSALTESQTKTIIFLVVENRKLNMLRGIIKECDSDAFMVVMEAKELLGRGH